MSRKVLIFSAVTFAAGLISKISEEMAQGQTLKLIYATDTDIARFLKTKSEATAYDTKWDSYFLERDEKRMTRNFDGRNRLSYLFEFPTAYSFEAGDS